MRTKESKKGGGGGGDGERASERGFRPILSKTSERERERDGRMHDPRVRKHRKRSIHLAVLGHFKSS
jgi:hypothetical protein